MDRQVLWGPEDHREMLACQENTASQENKALKEKREILVES